jgi:DNA-directed RNA polymerase subunit RPC12/RpoP
VLSGRTNRTAIKGEMIMYASVYVDGNRVEDGDVEAPESVTVEFDTDGYSYRCADCGDSVDEDGDNGTECTSKCAECGRRLNGRADGNDPDDEECDGIHTCAETCDADECECDSMACNGVVPVKATHTPEPVPLSWANSAGIRLNEDADEITVTISVGDPRGAFAFTVRRVTPDEGEPYLVMNTPYPGMGWAHMPITGSDGSYRVMPYGWTPEAQ